MTYLNALSVYGIHTGHNVSLLMKLIDLRLIEPEGAALTCRVLIINSGGQWAQ